MRGHMTKKKWSQGLAHKGDLTVKGSLDMHESLLVHGNLRIEEDAILRNKVIVQGSLRCKHLRVDGDIQVDEEIYAPEGVTVMGSLTAKSMFTNGGVFVGKDLTISQILVVGGGTYVEKILSVGQVFHPKEAVKCSSIVIQKAKSTSISQIVGHPWLILILDNHIMIGCVLYTKRKWSTITDDHIGKISPHGLAWWQKNKDLIRFLAGRR